VQAALVAAAGDLFARKGPSGVGVREIARAAGVNHGLVHRHFGSKEGLLRAVMSDLADRVDAELGEDRGETLDVLLPRLLASAGLLQGHWRILARAMLDGADPAEIQKEFPVFERILESARRTPPDRMSPEAVVTMVGATGLGLLLFGPWLKVATAQSDEAWVTTSRQIVGMSRLAVHR